MARLEGKDSGVHQKTVRLNRFLAMTGIGSRRKMDDLIASGRVAINGIPVETLGVQVRPGKDSVTVDGVVVDIVDRSVYILLNKPKDCITTLKDEKGRTTVLSFVRVKQRVFPVGRLDRNTTGVLLLTNDGNLAQNLLHPKFGIERVYKVTVDRSVSDDDLRSLTRGVRLEDGIARAQEISVIDPKKQKIYLSLTEGRNREVRRMFEARGYEVRQLDRVSYAGLTCSGVPRGSWRFLTRDEITYLRNLTGRPERRPGESPTKNRKRGGRSYAS